MLLSDKERIILAASCLDAEIPVSEIARRTRLKEHTVRHALKSLEMSGRISRATYIDVYPLGFFYVQISLRLLPNLPNKSEFVSYLRESPRVSYYIHLGGDFETYVDIIVREVSELTDFLGELADRFGGIFSEKRVLFIESLTDYPLKCLGTSADNVKNLSFGKKFKTIPFDRLDHAILRHLSSNPLGATTEMARTLGERASTITYRVERLRSHGVIVGSRYFINTRKLGLQVFFIQVETRGVSQTVSDLVYGFVAREPAVYAIVRTVGHYDFLLEAAVQTGDEIESLTNRLAGLLGAHVVKVVAVPVLNYHKISFYPFNEFPG